MIKLIWELLMRRKNKKTKDIFGILIIVSVLAIFLTGIYFYINQKKIDLNKETLCRVDNQFNIHVIVADITDPLNNIQIIQVKKIFEKIISNLDKYEQLQVFFIDDKIENNPKPAIVLCNPGKGEGASELIANPALLKKRWEEKFHKPILELLKNLQKNNKHKSSPILETLQIVNNIALPIERDGHFKHKITIISDMIQNSKNISFYHDKPKQMKQFIKSVKFNKVKTDLTGVNIDINVVRRDNNEHLQTREYMDIWIDFFEQMNGQVDKIKMIDG